MNVTISVYLVLSIIFSLILLIQKSGDGAKTGSDFVPKGKMDIIIYITILTAVLLGLMLIWIARSLNSH